MKRAVSISIGSSKRNKAVEVTLLGEKISIERIGTDGDMEAAADEAARGRGSFQLSNDRGPCGGGATQGGSKSARDMRRGALGELGAIGQRLGGGHAPAYCGYDLVQGRRHGELSIIEGESG